MSRAKALSQGDVDEILAFIGAYAALGFERVRYEQAMQSFGFGSPAVQQVLDRVTALNCAIGRRSNRVARILGDDDVLAAVDRWELWWRAQVGTPDPESTD